MKPMPDCGTHGPIMLVCALADELIHTVRIACALAESNRRIDLNGLERRVGTLCAQALDLPADDHRQLRAQLIALSNALDTLGRLLTAPPIPSA